MGGRFVSSGTLGVRSSDPARRPATRRPDPAGALFESIPHAVVILGREGHVVHANSAAEHLLKTALKDMRGRPLALGIEVPLDRALHGSRFDLRLPAGRDMVVRVDTEPALGADGKVYQVVCTLSDISDDIADIQVIENWRVGIEPVREVLVSRVAGAHA